MFENDGDLDFDDDLSLSSEGSKKIVPMKRPIDPLPNNVVKKTRLNLPKNIIKRKFPGPAGILSPFTETVPNSSSVKADELPCSQMSSSVFQKGPWLKMSQDYENLLEKFSIKWIKINANLNNLHNLKAPFLGAIIQSIECFNEKDSIVHVVLKDLTGEIQGSISHNLYEEYSSDLVVGSVIILKQFGVLTTGSNNNHYLTITSKNLVTIYTKSKDEENSEVKVIKLQEMSSEIFENKSKKSLKEVQSNNQNIFEDDLILPDNFEQCLINQNEAKKFNFKKKNVTASCSKVSVSTNEEDAAIWENALEGVDANSFFEEF